MAAFGARTALWVRRRSKNFLSFFSPCSRSIFRSTGTGPEHYRQLAIQHDVDGRDAPLTIAGSISQSGSSLSGAVHVDGSSCFDQRTAIALTGTLTNGNVSLTSTAVDGQVITLAGGITEKSGFPDSLTGTYTINGGCADGDQGNSAGYNVNSLTGYWAGNLTTAGGQTIHWDTQLNQNGPTVDGSSGLSGPFTFEDACVRSGTITSGTFPSASFIMGTSVVLEIKTESDAPLRSTAIHTTGREMGASDRAPGFFVPNLAIQNPSGKPSGWWPLEASGGEQDLRET